MIVLSLVWLVWFAPCVQFSACFTWKEYPDSIIRVWNGSTVALRWDYNLSIAEQAAADVVISRFWKRGNESHLVQFASKDFLIGQATKYEEKLEPHITISRSEEATLIVSDVTKEDEAFYEFTVSLPTLSDFFSRNTTVLVGVQPTLHCQSSVSIRKGDQAILQCSVTGDPKPNITWTKESEPENIISYNSTLVIDNVRISDGGMYKVTAYNGRSASVLVILTVTFPPAISYAEPDYQVLEGNGAILFCNATGNPQPNITWTKQGNKSKLSTSETLNLTKLMREDDGSVYKCTVTNEIGSAEATTVITVFYAPDTANLTTVPSNRTLLRGSIMTLNCRADASPEAEYQFYFNGNLIGNRSSGVFNTPVMADGVYTCVAINAFGRGENATVDVATVVAPHAELTAQNDSVIEGGNVTLTCNVSGDPFPSIRLTDLGSSEVLSNTTSHTIVNIRRPGTPDNIIQYQCTASNGVETPARDITNVTVYHAPDTTTLTTVPSNRTLLRGSIMTLNCRADASPEAEYQFYFNGNLIGNSSSGVFNTTVKANGVYTCIPINTFGRGENATVQVTTVVPESNSILVTLTVTNKGCDDNPSEICEEIRKKVEERIKGDDELKEPKSVTVKNCKCGSVTAYLSLDFTENVKIPDVISVLKEAAEGNGFGVFQVDPGSIQAISEEQLPTDSPSSTVGTTTSEDDKDKDKDKEMLWIIIGASVGGAIVLIIVVAVVAWCVHHKRKCRRKGSKVRCSESEAFAPEEDNGYGHVNNGYADAGPRPTAMEDVNQHQGALAVPTYAVVDKSAKKASKKNKKVEEEKPQAAPPEYAAVDKSKKKKKEEPEGTYAEVDKSKKSRKKPKPGEVLYADLGDFHQMQELPAVSTSPQALPPIKKPAPYGETQYADITQFLKGNATLPESNSSQGPDTGTQAAPASEKSNSQEPGTSTKETSQASNPGGDGGPGHETNF